jgi:hypothetical protein
MIFENRFPFFGSRFNEKHQARLTAGLIDLTRLLRDATRHQKPKPIGPMRMNAPGP